MAKNSISNVGGLLGGLLGLVIVGGLLATPFYLAMLQSDDRGLDAQVDDQVQHIRRVVLNLDSHLSAISDIYMTPGEDSKPDGEQIDEFLDGLTDEDKEQLDAALRLKDLNRTATQLATLEKNDEERGTIIEGQGQIQRAKPNVKSASSSMHQRLLKNHGKLIREAEQSISEIRSASQDFGNPASHMGVARAAALLYFAEGRIYRNRAEFEQMQAGMLQRQAAALVDVVVDFRRGSKVARIRIPDDVLAGIVGKAEEGEKNIKVLEALATELSSIIGTITTRIQELESIARDAHARMAALETSGAPIHAGGSEYQSLSRTARAAEAEIATLRDGSLSGATLAGEDLDDILTRHYEGGNIQHGLDSLKARLAMLEEQIAGRRQMKRTFDTQHKQLLQEKETLTSEAESYESVADERLAAIDDLMAAADEHLAKADEAVEEALKSFLKASSNADAAALAASRRRSGAREKQAEAKGDEAERLSMISSDGEFEVFLQCLSADISYSSALVLAQQIEALSLGHHLRLHVAEMSEGDPPASVKRECAELRERAMKHLARVSQYYTKADNSRAYTRAPGLQPKNFAWQLKVGEATGLLLKASLRPDEDARQEERESAYKLLVEAAQGRERSPLLSATIATIKQMQSSH